MQPTVLKTSTTTSIRHRLNHLVVAVLAVGGGVLGMACAPAHASTDPVPLWVRHSSTVSANMGQCAITLSFDSQTQTVQGMKLKVSLLDTRGAVQARGEIEVPDFGQSEAQRFTDAHWGHAALCDDGLVLRIDEARARVLGKSFDLLAKELLEVEEFKPMPIRFGKAPPKRKP